MEECTVLRNSEKNKVLIIAEAGVNHNGSVEIAKQLAYAAKQSGANCVKYQSFSTGELVSRTAKLAPYQREGISQNQYQYDLLKKLELSQKSHKELISYCKQIDIDFLSTPFDVPSLHMLLNLGLKSVKISSGDLTNPFLLKALPMKNLRVILSTGMANETEIQDALDCFDFKVANAVDLSLLHCTSEYPCPLDQVNLKAITTMKRKFKVPVGFSDHSKEIFTPALAVSVGATIIEKHITLDRKLSGPDHKASLEPSEFKKMSELIRSAEKSLGSGIKEPSIKELENKDTMRKSLVASCAIKKGEHFSMDNLTAKRPGTGVSPMYATHIIGKKADQDYAPGSKIRFMP
jgi:N,N'-diacetyllegionaminate synthase